jgi:hypothetical protein
MACAVYDPLLKDFLAGPVELGRAGEAHAIPRLAPRRDFRQCDPWRRLVSPGRYDRIEALTFVISGAPKIALLATDL